MEPQTNLQKIACALVKKGLSQGEIGRQIGIDRSAISHLISGRWGVKRPTMRMAQGLIDLGAKHGISATGTVIRKRKDSDG